MSEASSILVSPEASHPMHVLTLRFDETLEPEFLQYYNKNTLRQSRLAMLFGFLLFAAFGALDFLLLPSIKEQLWLIRYLMVCPILLLLFGFSYLPAFQNKMQPLLAVTCFVASAGIVAMTILAPTPGNYLYYAGLLLVIVFLFTFTRMRFFYAVNLAFLIFLLYLASVLFQGKLSFPFVLNNAFFLMALIVLSATGNYALERSARIAFLQNKVIKEKTDALVSANEELVEVNQELTASLQQASLMFGALADVLPGNVLADRYLLHHKIGAGGFGTVFQATDQVEQSLVAIKILRPTRTQDPEKSLERFWVEGLAGKTINHPNCLKVLDYGVAPGMVAFLVMELLDGVSLWKRMRVKKISLRESVQYLISTSYALAAAHEQDIIHRDIKPSNIFLHQAPEGEMVKVLDFGVAKILNENIRADAPPITQTGILIGTPAYMAPELVQGKPCSRESDVFSLGVMAYELLVGVRPFPSKSDDYWSTLMDRVSTTPKHLQVVAPALPESLTQMVMRSLEKDPLLRPGAIEFARALEALELEELPEDTIDVSGDATFDDIKTQRRDSRNPWSKPTNSTTQETMREHTLALSQDDVSSDE